MQPQKLNTHISNLFNQELENLRNSVLTMGGVIEEQISNTITAIRDDNPRLAEKVVVNDIQVNALETQIDQECLRIIAKRHPTAGDLRLVLTVAKATTDIERMGDEVERIAKMVTRGKMPHSPVLRSNMVAIGEQVLEMLRGTLNAFARNDVDAAMHMHQQDEKIDVQYTNLLEHTLKEMQQSAEQAKDWLEVLWAVRAFERVGDRCKNICEYVIYLTHGTDFRHTSVEAMQKKLNENDQLTAIFPDAENPVFVGPLFLLCLPPVILVKSHGVI